MKCIYLRNIGCGFVHEHTSIYCVFDNSFATKHIYIDKQWCANVCEPCAKRLHRKHSGTEISAMQPWRLAPWLRPKPKPGILIPLPPALPLDI